MDELRGSQGSVENEITQTVETRLNEEHAEMKAQQQQNFRDLQTQTTEQQALLTKANAERATQQLNDFVELHEQCDATLAATKAESADLEARLNKEHTEKVTQLQKSADDLQAQAQGQQERLSQASEDFGTALKNEHAERMAQQQKDLATLHEQYDATFAATKESTEQLAELERQLPMLLAIASQTATVTPNATIPLHNINPDASLLQELRLIDGKLEPGRYQVDSPVRISGKIDITGEVDLVGTAGGRFSTAQFTVQNQGVLRASGVTFSDTVDATPMMTVQPGGSFEGLPGCIFERCAGYALFLNAGNATDSTGNATFATATLTGCTFRGNAHGAVQVMGVKAGGGTVAMFECDIIDNGPSGTGAVNVSGVNASATIDGGEVRGNTGGRASIFAESQGRASVTNVKWADNTPMNTGADANGSITGS
jgi:hypothetical protein